MSNKPIGLTSQFRSSSFVLASRQGCYFCLHDTNFTLTAADIGPRAWPILDRYVLWWATHCCVTNGAQTVWKETSEKLCGSAVEIRSIASKFDVAKRVHCEVTLRRLCPCRQEPFHSTREMTGKSCYNIMTTSSHCSTVIVYFLSKMKKGLEKNYRQLYKRRQISIQNKGVLTINLYSQGRGKTRSERNLDWDGLVWREGRTSCVQRLGRKEWDA